LRNTASTNMLKHAILFIVAINCLSLRSIASAAAASNFSGNWEYVEHVDGSGKPYSTFKIKLNEKSDGVVTGSYCFITQSGNRIDCDTDGAKNIVGHIDENSQHAQVRFYSFFGAKDGVADLSYSDDTLTWKVTSNPVGEFFYGPYVAKLSRKQPDRHENQRRVVVDKAYLYASPIKTKVETYAVKGSFVKLLNLSDDLKFWKISYSSKNGTQIERWIDCHAIDFCP
jgi:hypothetical protein